MHHQLWEPGTRVMNNRGAYATLLAKTWEGWAWIVYETTNIPETIPAHELHLACAPATPHRSCY